MTFSPTYLYIKQHSVTGKLYFGKTTRNPEKYEGSGHHWQRHIKKHGKEYVVTLWYCLFLDKEDCVDFANTFSRKHNIVESKEWANLTEENGLDGGNNRDGWNTKRKEEFSQQIKSLWESRTPEERHKIAMKGILTHPNRFDNAFGHKTKTCSTEKRSKIMIEARFRMSAESKSKAAKLGKERMGAQKRKDSARKGVQNRDLKTEILAREKAKITRNMRSEEEQNKIRLNISAGRTGKCLGKNNGRAIRLHISGTVYDTKKEVYEKLGISEYILNKMILNGECLSMTKEI